jgi:hypothetical protein
MTDEETAATRIINQITLDCLLNKEQYTKYFNNTMQRTSESNKRDRKFYKRRILQITKDMLADTGTQCVIPSDMLFAFDKFTKKCISYFKMIDKTDILQTDYVLDEQPITKTDELDEPPMFSLEETAQLLRRTVMVEKITMDKFVKRTQTVSANPQIIPLKREINLKNPDLRNKGIRKKKNVELIYDDKNETKEEKDTTASGCFVVDNL